MSAADEHNAVVVLRCVDLVRFTVPVSLAPQAGRLAAAVGAGERVVDLPRGVSSSGVATAVAYYEARADAAARGADLAEFDGEFVRVLSHDAAIDLVHAAHHLGDEGLFNLLVAERENV